MKLFGYNWLSIFLPDDAIVLSTDPRSVAEKKRRAD